CASNRGGLRDKIGKVAVTVGFVAAWEPVFLDHPDVHQRIVQVSAGEGAATAPRPAGFRIDGRWERLLEVRAQLARDQGTVRPAMTQPEKNLLWSLVRDPQAHPVHDRARALQELVLENDPQVPDYLLKELENDRIPQEWKAQLLFAAEDVHYPDPAHQARLR